MRYCGSMPVIGGAESMEDQRTKRGELRGDRLGAWIGILLIQSGCWWEARPGPVPVIEAARAPTFDLQRVESEEVGLRLFLRAGSAHDPVGLEGLACGLAQAQIAQSMDADEERMGRLQAAEMKWDLDVDRELISIEMHAHESALDDLASLLGDAVMTGEIADPHRHVVGGETQDLRAHDRLLDWLYAGHPYGHDPGCDQPLDATASPAQMEQFHADRYIRSVTHLVVEVPDPEAIPETSVAAIDDLVGRLAMLPPKLYEDVSPRMIPRPMEGRLVLAEGAPGELWLGWATPVYPGHGDWPAMLLASEVLASRLSALAPAVPQRAPSWLDAEGRTPGWLGIPLILGWSGVESQGEVLDAILPKLEDWIQGPYTGPELDRARAQLESRLEIGRSGRQAQADLLGWSESWKTLPAALAAVDADAMTAALSRHAPLDQLRVLAGIARGAEPDWILNEGVESETVDAAAASSYDWKMGVPIRIDLQEP